MRKLRSLLALGVLASCITTAGHAASVSYYLDQSNENVALPDGNNYALVTVDDNTAGSITFTVTALPSLTGLTPLSNFGIQEFAFSVTAANSIADSGVVSGQWTLPTGWSGNIPPPANNEDGFGAFELAVAGTGSSRQDPLVFRLNGTGLTINDFTELSTGTAAQGSVFFAAHIAGFSAPSSPENVTSAWFGGSTPVPAPAAIWLLGSALAGVAVAVRRVEKS
ncbi:MAG: hypothetical protein IT496_07375 [Gammaproteobacteria bacterium]|nr:hypothetical protein [Gammaproteobacteria bacterium]